MTLQEARRHQGSMMQRCECGQVGVWHITLRMDDGRDVVHVACCVEHRDRVIAENFDRPDVDMITFEEIGA